MNKNRDLKLIVERLQPHFHRRSQVRYAILITNDPYDHTYNFFFNEYPTAHRQRSIPLHSVTGSLTELEALIQALRHSVNFSLEFTGFAGLRWPSSDRLIEPKRERAE
ncbi:acetyl-CoA carboxylase [Lacticaseibacillus salsurivasis]|uniref:acetyl-CoA carboxylase n=1 Tax=Lacticaseibacillus salsurivasis TaxID=3081441 RepID=UPI0030C6C883